MCTTYDCRERDLVANVWVDQTRNDERLAVALTFFFILSHCCALEEPGKSLVGMPRGCLVKEGKCFEGIIIFDVGQQIILSHNRAIANILSVVVLTTGIINKKIWSDFLETLYHSKY